MLCGVVGNDRQINVASVVWNIIYNTLRVMFNGWDGDFGNLGPVWKVTFDM